LEIGFLVKLVVLVKNTENWVFGENSWKLVIGQNWQKLVFYSILRKKICENCFCAKIYL